MSNPLVSVVMAVRNECRRVRAAIQSMLDQTFRDFELVVVDDCSTDGTWDVICSFSDLRIVRVRNNRRLWAAAARNRALAVTRGRYIAITDGDDVALPQRLEKQAGFLERNRDVDILGTCAVCVDESGRELARFLLPEEHDEIVRRPFSGFWIINTTVMMREKVIRCLGGYHPAYRRAQDYEFWLRARKDFRFHNLQELLQVFLWEDKAEKWEGPLFQARAIAATIRREDLPLWAYMHVIPRAARMMLGPLYPILVRRRFTRRLWKQGEEGRRSLAGDSAIEY